MAGNSEAVFEDVSRRALGALDPGMFGFRRHLNGWLRDFAGIGTVAFAPIAWPQNQVPSYFRVKGDIHPTTAPGLVVRLQESVWGFPADETVPVNVLSILEDTGGSVLVAYIHEHGFNIDGWLGFSIGMGTRSGEMYSHMLGVHEDMRGKHDIGWYLKVLQAYLAVESGHHSMFWTFDPLRGANGRLNIEKLGATMVNLTVDKYGPMQSSLYGSVPTDRFTAHWDLLSPQMHDRLRAVADKRYERPGINLLGEIPLATVDSIDAILHERPQRVAYEIPGDIDQLLKTDPERAVEWRQQMRGVLGRLMDTRKADVMAEIANEGPIAMTLQVEPGAYVANGFSTGIDPERQERRSAYLLTTKG